MIPGWDEPAGPPRPDAGPQRLTVLYDEDCRLCRRARNWLAAEPAYIPLELIAAGSPAAIARFGPLGRTDGELVVIDDRGQAWVGPSAFLVAMWSTRRWRSWSYVMSSRAFVPLAERFFRLVSANRSRLGALLREPDCSWCEQSTEPAKGSA